MGLQLQIITPEHVIFDGEVDSVTVPGKNGSFQMLENHAPIVASLDVGTVEIHTHTKAKEFMDYVNDTGKIQRSPSDEKIFEVPVKSGIIELSNNKLTVLVE